jgi:hypothetical protein
MAFTRDQLAAEQARLLHMEDLCNAHGEADGATAARSQRRAIDKELERLSQADAGAGH